MMIHRKYLIEGIDRLGKSTLVNGILNTEGYNLVIHYDKPLDLNYYKCDDMHGFFCDPEKDTPNGRKKQFMTDLNHVMFQMIQNLNAPIIFDRAHLGETVYAPLYRKYDGDYVFDIEKAYQTDSARLILLISSNLDMITDDGLSFDPANKLIEQQRFLRAFSLSQIKDKIIIDVHNGKGGFKSKEQILDEALNKTMPK